jgi:hypothetical protein
VRAGCCPCCEVIILKLESKTLDVNCAAGAMLLDNRMPLADLEVVDDVDVKSYHSQASGVSINTTSTSSQLPRTIAEYLKASPFKQQLLDRRVFRHDSRAVHQFLRWHVF